MNKYKYRVVESIEEFRSLEDSWNQLAGENFFHQWAWNFRWWENFKDRGRLAIVLIIEQQPSCGPQMNSEGPNEKLVGIAPWYLSESMTQGTIVQNLTAGETCSDYQGLIVDSQHLEPVVDTLSDLICDLGEKTIFSGVDLFQVEGHRQQDPVINSLMLAVEEKGGQSSSYELGGTWRTRLDTDWEQFQKSIRSSFRRKTRKAGKRFATPEFEFSTTRDADELEKEWPQFVKLHQKRRHFLGEPGCFADPMFESFLKSASLDLAKENKARLNSVLKNSVPIAMTLEFLPENEVWMYQSGVDVDYLNLEPGHLVFTGSMMQAIQDGCQYFDFLRGDEPYKSKWNAVRHSVLTTKFVPNRLISKCRFQWWNTKKHVKNWTKKVIGSK